MLFGCKLLVGSLLAAEIEDPSTSEYGSFIDNLRDCVRHPRPHCMACGVPLLPKPSELQLPTLPEPTTQPIPSLVKGSSSKGKSTGRGRGLLLIGKEGESTVINLQPILLVSLGLLRNQEIKKIVMVIKREDMYMIACRDVHGVWWEFSSEGGTFCSGFKGIGFSESYTTMGKDDIHISESHIEHAFYVLGRLRRGQPSVSQLKKAAKTFVFAICEGGRMKILSDTFRDALTYGHAVRVSSQMETLAHSWSKMSKYIIANHHNQNEELSKVLKDEKEEILKQLQDKGMKKIGQAHLAYGLLLANNDASSSATSSD